MSKLVLINLLVQLCIINWSFVNVSEAPLPNDRQILGESVKRETTPESEEITTTRESNIRETIENEISTETATSETSTEPGLRKTTVESGLREKTMKSNLRGTTAESDIRQTNAESGSRETTTESEMRGEIKEMMETFCPLVDICDANSTNADLKSNGIVGLGRVSCCRGCSCHPDCKERMNCCYPEDYRNIDDTDKESSPYRCLYTRLGQDKYIDGTVPS